MTAPLFILLPGLHGTDELFGPMLDAAPPHAEARTVTYPQDPAMRFADYIAHVRPHLPRDRPYVIVAESFAGPIAITLAGERPEGLRGLVLANTFTRRPGSHAFLLLPMTPICKLSLPQWMCRRYLSGSDRLTVPVKAKDRRTPPEVYASRLRIALKLDVTPIFRGLDVPMLCLLGRRDYLIKPKPMAKLAAAHPRAAVQWFDAPHMLLQAQPAACWEAITAWRANAVESAPASAPP